MSPTAKSSTTTEPYPYPVTQNVANFVSLRLNATNFLRWKTQMLNILESYDLQGFIIGETKAPSRYLTSDTQDPKMPEASDTQNPNPTFLQWRRTDRLVKGWLIATLSEDALGIVVGLDT